MSYDLGFSPLLQPSRVPRLVMKNNGHQLSWTMGQKILILGGGVGGQVAANELRRLLGGEHRITVIERDTHHAFAPSFLWVMTGQRTPERITRVIFRRCCGPESMSCRPRFARSIFRDGGSRQIAGRSTTIT